MIWNNLIIVMSLSGTSIFSLYIITYSFAKKYFLPKWRYSLLKLAISFYLLPVSLTKYISLKYFPVFLQQQRTFESFSNKTNFILFNHHSIYFSKNYKYVIFLAGTLALICVVIVSIQLIQYIKVKKIIKEDFTNVVANKNIDNNCISIVCSKIANCPFVIGVFNPIIVLPMSIKLSSNTENYIIKHEIIHIKRKDILFKFLALIVMAIHWFNPFAYLLFYEICNMSEICCDREFLNNCDTFSEQTYKICPH